MPVHTVDVGGSGEPLRVPSQLTATPPAGVSPEPGLAWSRGDDARIRLWLDRKHHELLGFSHERGAHHYGNRG